MSKKTWDVIVVGAGSAGAAFALRTAQRGASVLLLEAGPDYRSHEMHEAWRAENPAVALLDPSASDGVVWPDLLATRTETQPAYPYWRGRGVGGSSSINGQIAIRPPMDDFLDWGIEGWSPEDVLPCFARLEDDEQFGAEPHHGAGGPIPVHRKSPDAWGSVDTALAAAGRAAGLPWSDDVNAPGATGVSPYPINSRGGRRVSVNDGYLEPGRTLPALEIVGDTLVDRILFDGDRAVGVRCVRDGAEVDLHASTVVLSAGVIHSPAILLRSGIGPAEDLAALGIEVRRDLPVGANLQDHPMTLVVLPLIESARIGMISDRHTNVCIRWSSAEGECANDLMAVAMNQNVLAMAEADAGRSGGGFGVWLNQAHSRGTVKLASTDPRVHPTVEERMLSDQRDLRRMREGIRTVVDLALRDEVAPILSQPIAAANAELFAVIHDDALLDQYLLATVADAQHGTSTCRMGAPGDPSTVVDAEGRVHGIDGLHVVDASILPAVPRANTNLTAIMIGELLADRIA